MSWHPLFRHVVCVGSLCSLNYNQLHTADLGPPWDPPRTAGENMWGLPRLPCAQDLGNWQDNACMDASNIVFLHEKPLLDLIPIHTAPNYFPVRLYK